MLVDINQLINSSIVLITVLINKKSQIHEGFWLFRGSRAVLHKEGFPNPYEALKELTRKTEKITKGSIHRFIDGLEITPALKDRLNQISPFNYTGI